MNLLRKVIYSTAATALLVSCTVQKYNAPDSGLGESFRNDTETGIDSLANIAKVNYREFFKDPVLVALIDKAMLQNNDLKVALKQIEFASLGYTRAKWGYAPTITATVASASISRPSDNSLNGISLSQFLGQKYIEDYNSSVSLSWEADIWGKIKASKQQALAEYLKTQEAAKAVKTRVVAEVAQGYYNLLMLDKQLEVTKENLTFADSTLTMLTKQQELGIITSLPVQQQQITLEQISKNIPAIEGQINIQENALSILTGVLPQSIERNARLDRITFPDYLSTGVPSQLLAYRPDVKSSELDFRKSIASIQIAKVSMYPAINITAQGGLNAYKSSNWFQVPGSLFGLLTGAIAQPILNGKQLKTRYRQSKVSSEQAEINFKQTVLTAVGEVSDALIQIEKLEVQQKIAESLVTKAEDVVNNSLTLYRFNEATYLEVIVAQSNRLQAELDLAAIRTQRLNAVTALYRSLGGGWQ